MNYHLVARYDSEMRVNPKLFISYSWTTPEHEAWVLELATDLREAGVDAILDKWDLKEGNDAYKFMEKMVNDPEIKKVLLICDKKYAEKANTRTGGVGAEAQIVGPELYSGQSESKFVAAIRERDEAGAPCVPIYYKSRIYIDFSDNVTFTENYEKLLRWIFDKPLYERPPVGKVPDFLLDDSRAVRFATNSLFRRALDGIKGSRSFALPATREYFELFISELEKLRISSDNTQFDDALILSINEFLHYRNELVEIISALATYMDSNDSRKIVHRFLEGMLRYIDRSPEQTSWRETDFDNYKFIVHELFLHCIAIYLKAENFSGALHLLREDYLVESRSERGSNPMSSYLIFRNSIESLDYRNKRLALRRISLQADILKERTSGAYIGMTDLMQADFVCYLRSVILLNDYAYWWPVTLVYASRHYAVPFEIFSRSKSKSYFDQIKKLIGVEDKASLEAQVVRLEKGDRLIPRWDYSSLSLRSVMSLEKLATS